MVLGCAWGSILMFSFVVNLEAAQKQSFDEEEEAEH